MRVKAATPAVGTETARARRPAYPAAADVALKVAVSWVRAPLCSAMMMLACMPLYDWALRWHQAVGVGGGGDRSFFTLAFLAVKVLTGLACHGYFFAIEYMGWLDCYKLDRRPFQFPGWATVTKNVRDWCIGTFLYLPVLVHYLL